MSNLPPGVSASMIPGNRPEDEASERFWQVLDERFELEHGTLRMEQINVLFSERHGDLIYRYVEKARDIAWQAGYDEGAAEAMLEYGLSQVREDQ